MCEKSLKEYVPRHIRLGVCACVPEIACFQDVLSEVSVVDDFGSVVRTDVFLRSFPVEDVMSKYLVKNFKLSALVDSGVPLKVVNINHSSSFDLAELQKICSDVESAENLVQRFEAQQKERESWFTDRSSESADVVE